MKQSIPHVLLQSLCTCSISSISLSSSKSSMLRFIRLWLFREFTIFLPASYRTTTKSLSQVISRVDLALAHLSLWKEAMLLITFVIIGNIVLDKQGCMVTVLTRHCSWFDHCLGSQPYSPSCSVPTLSYRCATLFAVPLRRDNLFHV